MKSRRKEKYPRNLTVNFRNIDVQTLQKYVDKYNVSVRHEPTPHEYSVLVARHFNSDLDVEDSKVLYRFVTGHKTPASKGGRSDSGSDSEGRTRGRSGRRQTGRRARGDSDASDSDDAPRAAKKRRRSGNGATSNGSRGPGPEDGPPVDEMVGTTVEVYWKEYSKWYQARVKEFGKTKKGFYTLVYDDGTEEYVKLEHNCVGKALGDHGNAMEDIQWRIVMPAGQQTTPNNGSYKRMITKAMRWLTRGKRPRNGKPEVAFRDICNTMQTMFWKQLSWRPNVQEPRRTPAWKLQVRKVLNSSFKRSETRNTFYIVP